MKILAPIAGLFMLGACVAPPPPAGPVPANQLVSCPEIVGRMMEIRQPIKDELVSASRQWVCMMGAYTETVGLLTSFIEVGTLELQDAEAIEVVRKSVRESLDQAAVSIRGGAAPEASLFWIDAALRGLVLLRTMERKI